MRNVVTVYFNVDKSQVTCKHVYIYAYIPVYVN